MAAFVDDYAEAMDQLPARPMTFVERTYTRLYLAKDSLDAPALDMYVYLHPNGLCIVGLAPSHSLLRTLQHAQQQPAAEAHSASVAAAEPVGAASAAFSTPQAAAEPLTTARDAPSTPLAAADPLAAASCEETPTCSTSSAAYSVKFNPKFIDVKANAKKKGQGKFLDTQSVLCHVCVGGQSTPVRCGIKGKLLEVNERLESCPELLLKRPNTDGYLAIVAPLDRDLATLRTSLMPVDEYLKLRGLEMDQLI